MKFYAINGSPRKNKNTATLLKAALEGVQSSIQGGNIETELVHLYDYQFQPCLSCFACKRLGGESYGTCAVNDSIKPLMEKLSEADGIIFGSPIYFAKISAKLQGFLERFLFQYFVYDDNYSSLAPKKMPIGFIYTMNVSEEDLQALNYRASLQYTEYFTGKIFTKPLVMHACNTYQFTDYSKYKVECFSEPEKAAYRDSHFPIDRENAFKMGVSLASQI